jgi:hypothetical protein
MNHQLTSTAIGHQPVIDAGFPTKAGRSDRAAAPGTMLRLWTTVQGTGAASRRVDDGEGLTEDALTLDGTEISHVHLLRCERPCMLELRDLRCSLWTAETMVSPGRPLWP